MQLEFFSKILKKYSKYQIKKIVH